MIRSFDAWEPVLRHTLASPDKNRSGEVTTAVEALATEGDMEVGVWEHSVGVSTEVEVEEVFFVLEGHLMVFFEDENGKHIERHLGPWDCVSCPAGVIHGYQNESVEPVYMQVMLGKGRDPDRMGYADEELFKNRNAHLES